MHLNAQIKWALDQCNAGRGLDTGGGGNHTYEHRVVGAIVAGLREKKAMAKRAGIKNETQQLDRDEIKIETLRNRANWAVPEYTCAFLDNGELYVVNPVCVCVCVCVCVLFV